MFQDTLSPVLSPLQRALLALVGGLLLFAGVAQLVVLRCDRAPVAGLDRLAADRVNPRADLPPRRRDGRVLVRLADAGFLAIERDKNDAALLHVVVPHGRAVVDCNLIGARVVVLRQDAHQVRLRVSGYEYVPAATARSGNGGTTCVTAGTASIPVHLTSALGHRSVFSGQGATAVPVGSHRASVP